MGGVPRFSMPSAATRGVAALLVGLSLLVAVSCGPPPAPAVPTNPISLGMGGVYGNASAGGASVSATGAWVAFTSDADNLVAGDTNGTRDVFLRNRLTGAITRVEEYATDAPRISADGRYVGYVSYGTTMGVYDRATGTSTEWAPTGYGAVAPAVSSDGTTAVYGAHSSFGIFTPSCRARNLATGVEVDCPHGGPGFGTVAFVAMSASARFVLYYWLDQDGGGTSGHYLWDRQAGAATLLSAPIISMGSTTAISDDGRYVAAMDYLSGQPLTVVVHDLSLATSTPLPVTGLDGNTVVIDVSADGSVVLLVSEATNLVPGDTNAAPDVFLWDVPGGTVQRISRTVVAGAELTYGGLHCGRGPGQLLADGSAGCVLAADALLPADTNNAVDAYLVG